MLQSLMIQSTDVSLLKSQYMAGIYMYTINANDFTVERHSKSSRKRLSVVRN